MRPAKRFLPLLVAIVLVSLAACGDEDPTTVAQGSSTTVEPTTTTEGGNGSTSTTETSAPAGTVIELSVVGGQVEGGGRHRVPLGDQVTLRVTSDVDDHVHLHGYDELVDVAAGETAELTFEATIPGVFEAELEDRRIPLVELEIS